MWKRQYLSNKIIVQGYAATSKEYGEVRNILEDIEARMEELVMAIPGAQRLLAIKGIGIKTVIVKSDTVCFPNIGNKVSNKQCGYKVLVEVLQIPW